MPDVLRRSGRRVALVVALLACLSTVAFGGGYRASQALLDDGAAYVVKGHTVAHVNGDTGRPDAEVARDLASGRERLEVVRSDTGVYVVNNDTGKVSRIDTARMAPGAEREGTPRTRFLSGGGSAWVVDVEQGVAEQVDPVSLRRTARVPLPAGVADAVVDDEGVLWVAAPDGTVSRVRDGAVSAPPLPPSPGARMTTVGGRPVVLAPRAGTATRIGRGGPEAPVQVLPVRTGRPELAVAGPGPVLYVAVEGSGELVAVDLDARTVRTQSLAVGPGADLGRPVVSMTRVAVPDLTGSRLVLLDRDLRSVVARVGVPADGEEFQVTVQGDRFYATAPYRRTGVVVEADGRNRPIDKGPGHGVAEPADEQAPPAAAPPAPSGAPAEAPPAPQRPTAAGTPAGPGPATPATPPRPGAPAPAPVPAAPAPASPAPAPVQVPDLLGDDKDAACAELTRLGLLCRLEPTGSAHQGRTGEVVATRPAAGTEVERGSEVVVRHSGDTEVPDVTGSTVEEACAELERVGLSCTRTDNGASAGPGERAFVVLGQSPGPGAAADAGSAVSVEHSTTVTADDYSGLNESDACAAVRAVGLRCELVDGGNAAGTPHPVGVVYAQDPAAGTERLAPGDGTSTGDVVRLTRKTVNDTTLPVGAYTGRSVDEACAAAQADGFTCRPEVRRPFRRPGVAYAQEPAAGTRAEGGSAITVYYDDRAPAQLKRWKKLGEPVWVISADPARPVPSGYEDLGATDLGLAYPPNPGDASGLVPLVSWQCGCQGHSPNHWYGPDGTSPGAGWTRGGYAGHLFGSNLVQGEMQEVWRLRRLNTSSTDYAYAVPGTPEWSYYTTQLTPVFAPDAPIGWTWRP